MEENKIGVHRGHCCYAHGCKYGDSDCPVVLGKVKQLYSCEDCGDTKLEDVTKLKDFNDMVFDRSIDGSQEVTVTLDLIRSLLF